ncbi:Transmembrane 9 super member 1 [Desmophyllum pertusum]|uniref:Transmembrane 9 super member 1 n=1 Tax=Desmophyllum pertusum TaxID=174260 RepID=A0A9W9YHS9_9CNID|nr:Transmembrane 9 super member 1 [Desmophyllum pertusum]
MGQLASYLDNNVPLLTRVSNVKKLHQTLELVVTAKSVTRLGHEKPTIPDAKCPDPVFSLSLPAFGSTSGAAVKSICASSNPAVWCVAIKSKTKIGSHTTIVQLSTSHPGNIGVSESPGYDDTELNDEDFDPDKDQFQYFLSCAKQVEPSQFNTGEVLDGDRMAVAMHEIMFKEQVQNKELCTVSLNRKEIGQLQEAIEDLYYFEFVLGKYSPIFTLKTQDYFLSLYANALRGSLQQFEVWVYVDGNNPQGITYLATVPEENWANSNRDSKTKDSGTDGRKSMRHVIYTSKNEPLTN